MVKYRDYDLTFAVGWYARPQGDGETHPTPGAHQLVAVVTPAAPRVSGDTGNKAREGLVTGRKFKCQM